MALGLLRGFTVPLTRVLFIGVDAWDKDLVLQWAQAGLLPTVRRFLERGAWGLTANPEGFYVGSVWPSFWTGLSPGRHGRYCYAQIRTGTYQHRRVTPLDTAGRPFWEALSQAGRRVAIIDVPKTAPSQQINGLQVVDWGTHDPEIGFCASPPSLAGEIESRFGPHPVGPCDAPARGPAELASLRDALLRGVKTKSELTGHFLSQGGWDLFLTVFAESHCVGHQFWHVHDPSHPRHDPALANALGDPMKDVYVAIDAEIGRLLARVGDDTAVFVLASHGMGPHYDGTFLLREILDRLQRAEVARPARVTARALEWAWSGVPGPVRRLLRPLRARAKANLGHASSLPNLAGHRYFQTPNNDVYGGIRINLEGREPHGRVRPGPEYDRICRDLARDLLALVNSGTGRPVVRRVLRTADLYRGERVRDLPDLVVEWDRETPISTIHSPKTGTIHGAYQGTRTGDHKLHGLLLAAGPAIVPGRLSEPVSVMQLAATVASRLGVQLADLDGAPVEELTRPAEPASGAGAAVGAR